MRVLSAIKILLSTGSVRYSDLNSLKKFGALILGILMGKPRELFSMCVSACVFLYLLFCLHHTLS